MARRRRDSRLWRVGSALAAWILLVAGLWLAPPAARAGPLDGVTGPVTEITAPVQQAVEQVAAPATAPPPPAPPPSAPPPPAPPPSAVQLPKIPVPDVPVKLPPVRLPKLPVAATSGSPPPVPKMAATASNTVAAATGTVTGAGETVTATGGEVTAATQSAAAEVTGAAASTVGSATTATEAALPAPPTAAGTTTTEPRRGPAGATASRSTAVDGPAPDLGAKATATPPEGANKVLPGVPARLLHPFIRVWPAVALLTEGPLASFVSDWSRSALAAFAEEVGGDSLRGEAPPLANPPPAAHTVGQPPFAPLAVPALTPFDWVTGESALFGLALFLVLGASTLAILALGRRELGLPMFRRGNRFPWRH